MERLCATPSRWETGVPVFDTFSSGIWKRSEALCVALLIWVSSCAVGSDSNGGVCVV